MVASLPTLETTVTLARPVWRKKTESAVSPCEKNLSFGCSSTSLGAIPALVRKAAGSNIFAVARLILWSPFGRSVNSQKRLSSVRAPHFGSILFHEIREGVGCNLRAIGGTKAHLWINAFRFINLHGLSRMLASGRFS
jgi:hypothetical protein